MRRRQRHEARSRGPISEPRARHIVAIGREAAVVLPVQGGINGNAARSTATGQMKELPGGLASKGFGVVDVFHKVEHRNGCSGQISQAVGQRMFGRPAHVTEGIQEARTAAQPHRQISAIRRRAKNRVVIAQRAEGAGISLATRAMRSPRSPLPCGRTPNPGGHGPERSGVTASQVVQRGSAPWRSSVSASVTRWNLKARTGPTPAASRRLPAPKRGRRAKMTR